MRTQMETVRDIIASAGTEGIRSEEIKRIALNESSVSCPDRFARYLVENGEVVGMKKERERTKTFWLLKNAPPELRVDRLF